MIEIGQLQIFYKTELSISVYNFKWDLLEYKLEGKKYDPD